MYKKILVSTDGSPHARHAVDAAIEMARAFDSALIVLHSRLRDATPAEVARAIETYAGTGVRRKLAAIGLEAAPLPVGGGGSGVSGAYLDVIGQHILDFTAEQAAAAGVTRVSKMTGVGRPHQVIIDAADDEDVDLIVLGSRGLGLIGGLLHGSVSQRVTQQAHRSCLVVCLPGDSKAPRRE